jgi:hypothetical protein
MADIFPLDTNTDALFLRPEPINILNDWINSLTKGDDVSPESILHLSLNQLVQISELCDQVEMDAEIYNRIKKLIEFVAACRTRVTPMECDALKAL